MADQTPITPLSAHKDQRVTPASRAFPTLLAAVADFILAERDLDDTGHSQDPAFGIWLRDAERAQDHLVDCLREFRELPCEVLADQPLFRTALVIDAMLGAEEPGKARRLQRDMQCSFFSRFQVAGICPTALHRNAMLVQACHLVKALADLPLFEFAPDVLTDDPALKEAPALAF